VNLLRWTAQSTVMVRGAFGKMEGISAAGVLEVDAISVATVSVFALLLFSGIESTHILVSRRTPFDIINPQTRVFSLSNHL
jgi:hypothetical protein